MFDRMHALASRTAVTATRIAVALLWLGGAFTACTNDSANSAPNPDANIPAPVERLWQVGGVEDTTLVFESFSRNDVVVDATDRILLIDRVAGRVAVLDSLGTLVDSWGQRGPGPGEFMFPVTLAVAPDGAVHVFDSEKQRLVVFSPDGTFREEYPEATGRPFRFRFRPDGTMVGSTPVRGRNGAVRLLTDSAGSWGTLASVPLAKPSGMIESVCNVIGYRVEPVFHPVLAWDAREDTVVSSVGEFAVTVHVPGATPRVLDRDTVRRSTDRTLAARELGAGRPIQFRGQKPCTVPTEQLLEFAEIEPEMPAYADLTLDARGHVWATRDVLSDEPTVADVYHLETGFVKSLLLGSARPVLFLRNSTMLSIERDEDDVPVLMAYRVPPSLLDSL